MSPTFKIINRNRALTTGASNLPAVPSPEKIQTWKRSRGGGGVVALPFIAPGIIHRPRATGLPVYYWDAATFALGKEAVEKGYAPSRVRLHGSVSEMQTRATELRHEVELYCQNNVALVAIRYAGTLGSLIKLYRNSEESGYAALKYNVAENYDYFFDMLDAHYGRRRLSGLTKAILFQWHKGFKKPRQIGGPPRLSQASRAMMMLRIILKFGVGLDDHCERLCKILSTLRFEQPASPQQYLTADHVEAFIRKAHELSFPSMALAQAFQFETALRQKDVIGEWWPDEDYRSERNRLRVARGLPPIRVETWTSGLVFGTHISPTLIMVKPTSKSHFKKLAISDLSLCPMVMAEFSKIPADQRIGAVIINELTGNPYRESTFRARWRTIADAACIPADHCSMHSRHGAITEGSEAGVDIELLRQFGTHSDKAMTQHYNRETLVKARKVHRARNAQRSAPDESRFDHGAVIDADEWSRT